MTKINTSAKHVLQLAADLEFLALDPDLDWDRIKAAATLRLLFAERDAARAAQDAARAAQDAAIREVGNLGRRIGQLEAAMERISKSGLPRGRVMAAAKIALEKKGEV